MTAHRQHPPLHENETDPDDPQVSAGDTGPRAGSGTSGPKPDAGTAERGKVDASLQSEQGGEDLKPSERGRKDR